MKNRVEVWRKMVVNIKLVKLTAEYKKQLTDMMDEWQLFGGELAVQRVGHE